MKRPLLSRLLSALLALAPASASAAPAPFARAFLETHCADCHDADTKKGGLDLSALPGGPENAQAFPVWVRIHDRIAAGEMPPKNKTRPPEAETRALLASLDKQLLESDLRLRALEGRAAVRRLNRNEYQNALRDLLALPHLEVADLLPPDGLRSAYDKLGEALDLSSAHMEASFQAVERALDAAVCTQPEPPPALSQKLYPSSIKFIQALRGGDGFLLKNFQVDPLFPLVPPKIPGMGNRYNRLEAANVAVKDVVQAASSVGLIRASDPSKYRSFAFKAPTAGLYRLRVSSWSFRLNQGVVEPNDRTEVASLWSDINRNANQLLGYLDAPSLRPTVTELVCHLRADAGVRFETESVRNTPGDIATCSAPGIAVDWLEIEGPLHETWPPASHRNLFGSLPVLPHLDATKTAPKRPGPASSTPPPTQKAIPQRNAAPDTRIYTVHSARPGEDARKLFGDFLPRAFRRPVPAAEVERYVALFQSRFEGGDCFENAMRHAYKAALCSPSFLLRSEDPTGLSQEALAARLALWLWNSIPDAPLREAAAAGTLRESRVLRAHVQRMLADPKSERFLADFLDQWLNLRKIEDTTPDRDLYPEYIPYLKDCMLAESRAFLRELFTRNLGVENLVSSSFLMLNGELAALYGLPGVDGHAMRRVALPEKTLRGGFITQAAVLKATANGTTTSPVLRGAWFNERILGLRIPPPPPNVGSVEPDTRGATTIREQLDKHRRDPGCALCHAKIDPPGFALESFDVIGAERTHYRSLGQGEDVDRVLRGGKRVVYKSGPPVDPSGELSGAGSFRDVVQLRERLLAQPDVLARNFIQQMLIYATGSETHYADRAELEQLLALSRAQGHRMTDILELIADSSLFQRK